MRKLLTMVALALTLGFGAALPAAADPGERSWRDWSEGPRYFHRAPEQSRRGRVIYSERYYDEDVRPRRRAHLGQRYTKRQQAARMAKKARRHQIARRPAKGQPRKVVVHRPRPHKPAAAAKLAPKVALATPPSTPSKKVCRPTARAAPASTALPRTIGKANASPRAESSTPTP